MYQIFHATCAECHGGHLAKPKGKLGYILDLRRLVDEGLILPGDPDQSDLFHALVSTDDEEKMPPPDSDGPKLTPEEIDLIRAWIAAGAMTRAVPAADLAETGTSPTPPPSVSSSRPLGRTLGRLHPLVVHFPIALLLCACASEVLSRVRSRHIDWLQGTTRGTLWLAALGGIAAAVFGWLNASYEGFASAEVDTHRWLGISTAALATIALVLSEYTERTRNRASTPGSRNILLGVLMIAAVIVILAGHTGGVLVYGADYFGW